MKLQEKDVWELVKLPKGRKTVGSKWVYKVRTGVDESIKCYETSMVAKEYTQEFKTDFNETFNLSSHHHRFISSPSRNVCADLSATSYN